MGPTSRSDGRPMSCNTLCLFSVDGEDFDVLLCLTCQALVQSSGALLNFPCLPKTTSVHFDRKKPGVVSVSRQ